MSIRENAITFLPVERATYPILTSDKLIALYFNFLYKIRDVNRRLDACKHVGMIGHAVCVSRLHKGSHILMEFFFVLPGNKILTAFYGKDKVQIDL